MCDVWVLWPWSEGCDLGGHLGSRTPRAASEKQNDGVWRTEDGKLILSGRDSLSCSFIHSLINVFCLGLNLALMTHYQLKLELVNTHLGLVVSWVTGAVGEVLALEKGPPLTGCVSLDKPFHLSWSQFPHL